MKKALIMGIGGQDGSHLAEILLEKGYEIHGLIRRTATGNTINIEHIIDKIILHYGDLSDPVSIYQIISKVRPGEIYNEADQDHAGISFKIPAYNFDLTGTAVGRNLEIIRDIDKNIKYFQPVTSNMFGKVSQSPQNEETPFNPQNPYACAKVFAWHLCRMYRQVYNMYVAVGIFYNHESPRRTNEYVFRKVTQSVARIKAGKQDKLILGDLNATIDWGYAKEYMEAAWNIMQQEKPDDFIIGTGEAHSVKELVDEAFAYVGLAPENYVESSKILYRPATNSILIADITKARERFGFDPKIKFKKLLKLMLEHDLKEEMINLKRRSSNI